MTALKTLFDWHEPKLFVQDSFLQRCMIFIVLGFVNILVGVESFGANICSELFRGYYHLDQDQTAWIAHSFLVGVVIAIPAYNHFRHRITVKKYFCMGLGMFVVCNLIGALSDSYSVLIASRILAGMSAGMAASSSGKILLRVVQGNLHPHAASLSTNLLGIGFAVSQTIGGIIAQSLHWRLIFVVDVVLIGIAMILILGALREYPIEDPSDQKIDYLGYSYYVLGLVGVELFFSEVKADWNTLGWRSDFSLVVAFLIIVCFVLLIRRCRDCSCAMFDKELFKSKTFIMMSCVSFVLGLNVWSGTQFITMLEGPFQYEHITIGLVLSTFGLSVFMSGTIVFFMSKFNPLYFVLIGLFLIGSSCFANHAITLQSSYRDIIMVIILRGIGVGMCLHPVNEFLKTRLSPNLQAKGDSFILVCRFFGGTVVSAIMVTIVTMRKVYHNLRFGEQVDVTSPAFQAYVRQFQLHAERKSDSWAEAMERAKGYVIDNIKAQSTVASFDDAFFLLGWVTMILLLIICIYELGRWRAKTSAAAEISDIHSR